MWESWWITNPLLSTAAIDPQTQPTAVWRVSCGGEQDVWESTPEFAAWHHPGIGEQYGDVEGVDVAAWRPEFLQWPLLNWVSFFAYMWYFTASVWMGCQAAWGLLNNVNGEIAAGTYLLNEIKEWVNLPTPGWDCKKGKSTPACTEASLSRIRIRISQDLIYLPISNFSETLKMFWGIDMHISTVPLVSWIISGDCNLQSIQKIPVRAHSQTFLQCYSPS